MSSVELFTDDPGIILRRFVDGCVQIASDYDRTDQKLREIGQSAKDHVDWLFRRAADTFAVLDCHHPKLCPEKRVLDKWTPAMGKVLKLFYGYVVQNSKSKRHVKNCDHVVHFFGSLDRVVVMFGKNILGSVQSTVLLCKIIAQLKDLPNDILSRSFPSRVGCSQWQVLIDVLDLARAAGSRRRRRDVFYIQKDVVDAGTLLSRRTSIAPDSPRSIGDTRRRPHIVELATGAVRINRMETTSTESTVDAIDNSVVNRGGHEPQVYGPTVQATTDSQTSQFHSTMVLRFRERPRAESDDSTTAVRPVPVGDMGCSKHIRVLDAVQSGRLSTDADGILERNAATSSRLCVTCTAGTMAEGGISGCPSQEEPDAERLDFAGRSEVFSDTEMELAVARRKIEELTGAVTAFTAREEASAMLIDRLNDQIGALSASLVAAVNDASVAQAEAEALRNELCLVRRGDVDVEMEDVGFRDSVAGI